MNFGRSVKFFNFRPLVSAWLFFMSGIIFFVGIYCNDTLYLVLAILSSMLCLTTVTLKLILAKRLKAIKVFIVLVSFVLGVSFCALTLFKYDSHEVLSGEYYLTGTVSNHTSTSGSGLKVVYLKNAKVDINNSNKKLQGEVRLYLEGDNGQAEELNIGEIIQGKFSLKTAEYTLNGKPNFYMLNKNTHYIGFGSENDIVKTAGINRNVFDKIKVKTNDVLHKFMSEEYGALGYTMLFGDKADLDQSLIDIYSASGIAHLLAVSGLHVGFIVVLFSFILSLLKVNNKVKLYIISLIILLYAFMCGFTISVSRALIMTVVLLFSKLRLRKYDSLSSVGFAGIIVLLINPLFLFDVGYQLSFSAVVGIILFSRTFTDLFNKFLTSKLSSSLAVSLSATIGTMPIIMLCFKKLSVFSIVANLIVVPLASMAFMLMFLFVIIQFIIPALGVFIYMFEVIMKLVTGVGQLLGAISLVGCSELLILLFGLFLICSAVFVSDYFILKKKNKVIMASASTITSFLCLILMFIC